MSVLALYAILDAPPADAPSLAGVADEPLALVPFEDLVVVAGTLAARPRPEAELLRRHDALVRALAARATAILPMRFGEVAADEAALRAGLERALPRLRRALAEVAGCEQRNLRLFGERGAADAGAAEPHSTPGTTAGSTPADPASAAPGPGTRYLAERRRRRDLATTAPHELAPLLERLAPLVRAERVQRPPTGRLLASVYQLVRTADRADYLTRLRAGLRELPGLCVAASGPFPPWAFADGVGERPHATENEP